MNLEIWKSGNLEIWTAFKKPSVLHFQISTFPNVQIHLSLFSNT